MSSYNTIPDLISSSVTIDLEKAGSSFGTSQKSSHILKEAIHPFSPNRSLLGAFTSELQSILGLREARKILVFLAVNIFGTAILLLCCHSTNSMALTAYTYLTFFDICSLLTCLLSVWIRLQKTSPAFSFGYERFEVLATFASTMLAQLASLFVVKESIERIIQQPEVHTGRLLVGLVCAFLLHMFLTYSMDNRALNHVATASSSSWLQEHMTDMSESLCYVVPGLSKLLLPRINPLALIAFAGGFSLTITYILIDTKNYFFADTIAAMLISLMICGTMFPMAVYAGKILLQTTPSHMLGQLDKVLREASTLDGVLEFRHEHFWTLSFGSLAGSVQVRVRRDADEQLVLAHVYSRLSNLVSTLTVQIFKDDWARGSTYNILGSSALPQGSAFYSSGSPSSTRVPSPTQDLSYTSPSSYFKPTLAPQAFGDHSLSQPAGGYLEHKGVGFQAPGVGPMYGATGQSSHGHSHGVGGHGHSHN